MNVARALGALFVCAVATHAVPASPILGGASFADGRARLASGVSIELRALGRGTTLDRLAAHGARRVAGEVHVARAPGVTEWWRAVPAGLEHGVTLAERPAGGGSLVLELGIDGAVARARGEAVSLRDAHTGVELASYGGLAVLDARGRALPAALSASGGTITVEVDDRGAHYPIVVDPLVVTREATLTRTTAFMGGRFGSAVALDAAGTTLVVGARGESDAGATGRVRVYGLGGTTWTERAELAFPADISAARGWAVAVTGDGTRIVVGAPTPSVSAGRAYVFSGGGSTWALEATLEPAVRSTDEEFGRSVAISASGDLIVVGAPLADPDDRGTPLLNAGAAYVFRRTGTAWAEETVLIGESPNAGNELGASVAVSGDGRRIAIGAPREAHAELTPGCLTGTVQVYLDDGAWSRDGFQLATAGCGQQFGASIALSADGRVLLVGAPVTDLMPAPMNAGAAVIANHDGTSWVLGPELRFPSPMSLDAVGTAVALSADGRRAVVSGAGRDSGGASDVGEALLFSLEAGTWVAGATLLSDAPATFDGAGMAVAIAPGGGRVALGLPNDDVALAADQGTVTVFSVRPTEPNGVACTSARFCTSGFCVDGVCCDAACSGDCDACAIAAGGSIDGACGPLAVPSSRTCRAAGGTCDVAEVCGTAPDCPSDVRVAGGTTCRASAGPCDPAEVCDGTSVACPGDVLEPSGTVCGTSADDCATPGTCSGTSPLCSSAAVRPAGTPCRAAVNGCDVADVCDGVSQVCADAFAPAATLCGTTPSGDCDAPDHCAGDSASCVPTFTVGAVCRASVGSCDPPELCGSAPDCAADQLVPSGVVCRASVDPSCDVAEVCDGIAALCPADVVSCGDAGPIDGGALATDAGRIDAGAIDAAGADAGSPVVSSPGCGCRAGARASWSAGLLVGLAILARRAGQLRP